jgi:hypothetical protein
MSQPATNPNLVRFGLFELDVRAGELRKRRRNSFKARDRTYRLTR